MNHEQAGDTPPSGAGADAPTDDAKARFREALDRKKQQARQGGTGRRNTGSVHGPEVIGGQRRTFRRKSG